MASKLVTDIMEKGEPVDILYGRLSQEDDHTGDSNSIVNQRNYLEKYASDNGFQAPVFMADDGYSGTNFNRPAWRDIVTLIEAGLVRTLIVKDMSRLGREYLKVGELTELYFPTKGVRFIAVNDGVDSLVESSGDFNPIRNWANELHAKDTSRKVRSVKRMQAERGERLGGKPPYGYRKRDGDSKHLVPDEETKDVVLHIFQLCAAGKGPNQIARILREERVLNPTNQYYRQTGVVCTRLDTSRPYTWTGATVANILRNPVYLGHTLNMQSSTLSYKNKKVIHHPKEKQVLVENTHEAIISQELWDTVQRIREHKRRPPKHMDDPGLFAGLVYCADCGGYMVLCRTEKMKPEQYYFRCSTYGKRGKEICSSHRITETDLRTIVLDDLRRVTHFARTKRQQFAAHINQKSTAQLRKEMAILQRDLGRMEKRKSELSMLFKRLYEDNVLGKLSNEQFRMLSADYIAEQNSLDAAIPQARQRVEKLRSSVSNVDAFVEKAARYTEISELTPELLWLFIERIEIGARPAPYDRNGMQDIRIIYRDIGLVDSPVQTNESDTVPSLEEADRQMTVQDRLVS